MEVSMRIIFGAFCISMMIAAIAGCEQKPANDPSTVGPASCDEVEPCATPSPADAEPGTCPEGCKWDEACKKCKDGRGVIIQE